MDKELEEAMASSNNCYHAKPCFSCRDRSLLKAEVTRLRAEVAAKDKRIENAILKVIRLNDERRFKRGRVQGNITIVLADAIDELKYLRKAALSPSSPEECRCDSCKAGEAEFEAWRKSKCRHTSNGQYCAKCAEKPAPPSEAAGKSCDECHGSRRAWVSRPDPLLGMVSSVESCPKCGPTPPAKEDGK